MKFSVLYECSIQTYLAGYISIIIGWALPKLVISGNNPSIMQYTGNATKQYLTMNIDTIVTFASAWVYNVRDSGLVVISWIARSLFQIETINRSNFNWDLDLHYSHLRNVASTSTRSSNIRRAFFWLNNIVK